MTLVIGCAVFGLPIAAGAGSVLSGFLSGAWPIGWIVLMAVWLYRIAVRAGNFDTVRASVSSITDDQRIQVLLIAFCLVDSSKVRLVSVSRSLFVPPCWCPWASTRSRPQCWHWSLTLHPARMAPSVFP